VFWFTGAGASSAHATYEGMQAWRRMAARQAAEPGGHDAQQPDAPTGPPTGVAVFAADTTIRSLLDPGASMHWSEFDRGGHFPAMEAPDLLVEDLRAFFRPLRPKEGS
jgi:pimeloyl-ACP methyl ester carboxylesterase